MYFPLQQVKADVLQEYLKDHPDGREVNFIVDIFKNGFELGLTMFPEPRPQSKNSNAVQEHPDMAQALVDQEVALGHILGPFDTPPIPGLVFSPLHMLPKPTLTAGWRLIYYLSAPYDKGSVNNCILEENSTVEYHYIDELIEIALRLGPDIYGVRLDIVYQHAYCNVPLKFSQLRFLAFSIMTKYS